MAWVDESDYDDLDRFNWTALRVGGRDYATRNTADRATEYMHRRIMSGAEEVDHIRHHEGLLVVDNRRSNLRAATRSLNNGNQRKRANAASDFKGVSPRIKKGWTAYIRGESGKLHLGSFSSEITAALAYDQAAVQRFGAFACTNFQTPGAGNWLYDPMPFGLVRHQPEVTHGQGQQEQR